MSTLRILACVLLGAAAVLAQAAEREPTLKDLKRATPEVRKGETVAPDADRARELYRGFLELQSDDAELTTEALRRLGDLELEAGETARGELADEQAGRGETLAAIDIYTRLLAERPDYPRADAVLYQLARAWEAEGQPDKALGYLDTLVARYPGSPRLDEAQFRRGEILFSAQDWVSAERAYASVIGIGERSEFFEQSLYKHGWALFKQSQTEESAASFLALLDRKLRDPRDASRSLQPDDLARADREMVTDSFRALAIQFSALEGADTLRSVLDQHGPTPYAWLLYAALGDLMVEKERYTDAADTYRAFAARDPDNEYAPVLQARAIEAYLKGGFADLALQGKREFVERYAFTGSFWLNRTRESHPEVAAQLKTNLKDVAQHYHATAQASGKRQDYQEAARWYRDYLSSFPDDPDSAETNYLLADTLYESGNFGDAALEYERTAYDYPVNERSATAGYAALVSYEKHEATLAGEARDQWHRAGIESALSFANKFPEHPESGKMLLRSAQQLFNLKELERASAVAAQAVVHVPVLTPEQLRTAWNVAADAEFELGRFQQAEGAYTEVLARMPPQDPERATISERLAAAVYKQGEAKQVAGDAGGAIEDFLRVGLLAPGSSIQANAQYDAAALLIQAKQWDRAIPVLEAFRRDYPDNELAANIPGSLAVAYSESGRPLQAAVEFARIADAASETPEVRRAALLQAADLYEQGGDAAQTAVMWTRFVERYPQPLDDAMAARQKLADLARARGDTGARNRWLTDIIAAHGAAGTAATDSSRLLAARASLELAAPKKVAFEAIALTAPLAKTLKAKRTALEDALKAYQAAADYGVADVVTASTYATAEMYRRLAKDLMESERPANLTADEVEQYDVLLEEQAYPFEERAIELHETNAARTVDGLYDDSVRGSLDALAALKPARYAKREIPAAAGADGVLGQALVAAEAGQWELAESAFSAAVEAGVGAPGLTGLGLAYRNTGRFELAEGAYREALVADPLYGPALLNLGVLLDLYLQQPAAALQQYETYQTTLLEPDPGVARWIAEVRTRAGSVAQSAGATE